MASVMARIAQSNAVRRFVPECGIPSPRFQVVDSRLHAGCAAILTGTGVSLEDGISKGLIAWGAEVSAPQCRMSTLPKGMGCAPEMEICGGLDTGSSYACANGCAVSVAQVSPAQCGGDFGPLFWRQDASYCCRSARPGSADLLAYACSFGRVVGQVFMTRSACIRAELDTLTDIGLSALVAVSPVHPWHGRLQSRC